MTPSSNFFPFVLILGCAIFGFMAERVGGAAGKRAKARSQVRGVPAQPPYAADTGWVGAPPIVSTPQGPAKAEWQEMIIAAATVAASRQSHEAVSAQDLERIAAAHERARPPMAGV